jgi:hypothetical protein
MAPKHFEALEAAIAPLDTPERRARYLAGDFKNADRCRDLALRYRWDLLWEAFPVKEWWTYLNDAHVDTALRRIVKDLVK